MSLFKSVSTVVLLALMVPAIGYGADEPNRCVERLYGPYSENLASAMFYLGKDPQSVLQGFLNVPEHTVKSIEDDKIILKTGLILPRREAAEGDSESLFRLTLPTGVKVTALFETSIIRWVTRTEVLYGFQLDSYSTLEFTPAHGDREKLGKPTEQFFENQAEKQVQDSETYKAADGRGKLDIQTAQALAFSALWADIFQGETVAPLTLENLGKFKSRVLALPNAGGDGYGVSSFIEGPKVARTRQQLLAAGVRLPEYMIRTGAGVRFVSHESVDFFLERWIEQFNAIDHDTGLLQIAYLFQIYQYIHPYVDAEGRTTRALLDIMLAKAGLGVLDHSARTSMVFYLSLDELAMFIQSQLRKPNFQ
ncbi:MAG: Fic family protein [Bdellovibrionales bacterium]|nr:Fic family protein [Bdellovibrionales bacterium]